MDEFEIEKHSEPPADYVSWSLNNFKVEDVTDNPVLCNLEPWDSVPCNEPPVTQDAFVPEPSNIKMELPSEMQQSLPPQQVDAESILSEDQLSTVDLSHICEIVGNKEDADQPKQFICLYCGLQLTFTNLCLHMKFGHNNHDKIKLCKRFDCEYHLKMNVEAAAEIDATNMNLPMENKEQPMNGGIMVEQVELHKCQMCDFQTKKKTNLRDHIKYTHTKEEDIEMHKCLICGFQTKYKYGLKKHAKKHSELTLHKCNFCDYQTIMPLLLEHIKFKHSGEEQAGAMQ